ncbi:hypothetical protein [Paenibacillus allorhizoplanae]|uniref:hypothetical protein n=1 Tax=Paenibacillus allorhizoplanae TaxID=2905648 RepID=UPI001F490E09|nr:hypothetical protein [Paenibacillus allorhizoplanae]
MKTKNTIGFSTGLSPLPQQAENKYSKSFDQIYVRSSNAYLLHVFDDREHNTIFFTFRGNAIGGEIKISFPVEIEEVSWIEPQTVEEYIRIPSELKGLITNKSSHHIYLEEWLPQYLIKFVELTENVS